MNLKLSVQQIVSILDTYTDFMKFMQKSKQYQTIQI